MTTRKYLINSGDKYGSYTVLDELSLRIGKSGRRERAVLCRCDCGKENIILLRNLIHRPNISCGCKSNRGFKHGFSGHELYDRWYGMRSRCYNKKNKFYKDYGGRGIRVCDEWLDSFHTFYKWSIENNFSKELHLDRYPDNDGDYSPSNCRWATPTQNSNNRRSNVKFSYNNEKLTLSEIASIEGIGCKLLRSRIYRNMTLEKAISLGRGDSRVRRRVRKKDSMASMCSEYKISYYSVLRDMKKNKLPFIESYYNHFCELETVY